ncbi:MAG: nicotinate-nucleotide adenylyltransferase [Acidobacteriota bacterium]
MKGRIGLFGGSFDPVHRGHLDPILDARRRLGLERVIFLPTARPPHKPKRRFAPALMRYAMVELALLDEPDLWVSDHELLGEGPTYTVDTVAHFADRWPGAELVLLIGSDSFAELPTWRRWRELIERIRLAVLVRPGWEPEALRGELPAELRRLMDRQRIDFVADRPRPISSTDLRDRLATGDELPDGWIPEQVLRFIEKYKLYR